MRARHSRWIPPSLMALLLLSGQLASAARPQGLSQSVRQDWKIQRVEDVHEIASSMGDHAALYDAGGRLHVVYGGDHLYYARCTGGSCSVETVDGADHVGLYASLAFDHQGYPHIAYYDLGGMDSCDDEAVKYAGWSGSRWEIQVVDQGCTGKYPSIALDGQDRPQISYYDEVSDDLQLADWDGSGWNTYTPAWLPSFNYSGSPSSLLADAQGDLHLAFIAGSGAGGTVWYNRKTGNTWGIPVEVDAQPGATGLALALDSASRPHLSYNHRHFDPSAGDFVTKLSYTAFDGSAWLARQEAADMDYLGWTALMVGQDGQPRLAYQVGGSLAQVARTGGGWGTPSSVPNTGGAGRMYLAQAAPGVLGLTYFGGGVLQNVRGAPPLEPWSAPVVIDESGWVGAHIALVTSPSGDAHVAYTDHAEQQLRYARRPAGGAWQVEAVLSASGGRLIQAVDIDLDSAGAPHIVYQEYNQIDQRSALKYVNWSGSTWVSWGAVHQPLHNGCDPSLELDAANTIYIAYNDCDYIHDNLVLAIYNGTWQYQTVDPQGDTSSASLVVDQRGYLYASYLFSDYPNSQVRLAKKEDTVGWVIEPVAAASATNTSLVLDGGGRPHIAFAVSHDPDYTVKLADWDGQGWQVGTVITTTYWSEAQLAIDAQDRPHLVFECWHHPCYAVREGSSWSIADPLDRPPADPDYSFALTSSAAIGLGNTGLPLVVYDGELDLKAAELVEEQLVFLPLLEK